MKLKHALEVIASQIDIIIFADGAPVFSGKIGSFAESYILEKIGNYMDRNVNKIGMTRSGKLTITC